MTLALVLGWGVVCWFGLGTVGLLNPRGRER